MERTSSGVYDYLFAPYYTDEAFLHHLHMAGNERMPGEYVYSQASDVTTLCSPDPTMISLPSSHSQSGTGSGESSQDSVYYDALEWIESESGQVQMSREGGTGQGLTIISRMVTTGSAGTSSAPAFSPSGHVEARSAGEISPSRSAFGSLPPFMLPDAPASSLSQPVSSPSSSAHFHPLAPLFPQEIFFSILSHLPPRAAYSARLVSKAWYRDFWYVLVLQHWFPPSGRAEVELFIRTPQSWIFEEFSVSTHGGHSMVLTKREVVPMEDAVEIVGTFSLSPSYEDEVDALRRKLLRPVQLLASFRSQRYWDFRVDVHLQWEDTTLLLDLKQLLGALLGPEEDEWPGPNDIPVWVWRAPIGRAGTRGTWERYRHWSPTL